MKKLFTLVFGLLFTFLLQAQTATAPSGDGSSSNPYQIATVNNLYWLSQNSAYWGKYFIQTANIDASSISNFTPIGNGTTKFTGTYNGYGYTISGLTESRTAAYSGLFGYINGATITNLGVVNASISCYSFSGILIGYSLGASSVTQCFATGTISSTGGAVGGLIGEIDAVGTLKNCYSICTVSSTVSGNFGGLVGYNYSGTVITNCYSSSTVSASGNIGGLVGNSGTVSSNSYYNSGLCSSGSAYATPKSATELQTQSTFSGWDFSATWGISSSANNGYPNLTKFCTVVTSTTPDGSGTSDNPYKIASFNNLYWLSQTSSAWSSYFIQTADIDALSATASWNSNSGFSPIGNGTTRFYGNYNGNGHVIYGLTINLPSTDDIGLFGFSDGTVSNVRLTSASITGNGSVGGVVGRSEYGTITNCCNTGTVSGHKACVGGILGDGYHVNITNCYNTGAISGRNDVGGIAGFGQYGNITNSYSTGSVTGTTTTYIGNVLGISYSCSMNYCYDLGSYTSDYMKSADFVTLLNANRGIYNYWVATSSYPTFGLNIYYVLNGGTNNAGNPSSYTCGVEVTLSNPTRTGYTFGGWYDNAGFSGSAITAISTTAFSDVTLYAKWTASTYNITYNLYGGTNAIANAATYTYGVGLTLNNPTRTGYTFGGWYDNANFTGTTVTAISTTSTGDVTLYAKWTANTYNITYNLYGGTNATANTATYTYGVGLTLSSPTRTGYTFGGWYDNANFTGTTITAISTTATGDVTLYAKWTVNIYNITYTLNGGTNNAANTATYTYGVGLTLSNPTRTGYTFGGWYADAGYTGTAITAISTTATSDVTLYAKWAANYNITYNLNGGINSAANTATYTSGVGLTLSNPTQTGYTFVGWYTDAGFTGTTVASISTTATGDVTLYARWIAGGTSNNPIQIASLADLKLLSENPGIWNQDFIQTADIDASETSSWNSGSGFSPIGNSITKFTGQYNGNGHTISGLTIHQPSTGNIGLFGCTSGATISNLGLTNAIITGGGYTGAIIGNAVSSNLSNSYCKGTVSGSSDYVGGLVGWFNGNSTSISGCYFSGSVSGASFVGGIAGQNYSGNYSSNITNCYCTGSVTGSGSYIGGITGDNLYASISYCYSSGAVSGGSSGGITGRNYSAIITHCFWDTQTTKQSSGYGTATRGTFSGSGKTTTAMKTQSTFTDNGWDFIGETANGTNDSWALSSNINTGYPCFTWQGTLTVPTVTTQAVSDITGTTATGNGTVTDLGFPNPSAHGVCWSTTQGAETVTGNFVSNGTASATGVFTASITSLSVNTTYYVKAYATNSAGTAYGDEVSFTTIAPGTWTGAISSDWNVADNWVGLAIPTSSTDVIIPTGVPNFPVISATSTANCHNITVNTGASLIIASSDSGTGSLIVTGTSSGTVTAGRWITADQWHIISPIVSGQMVADFLTENTNIPEKSGNRGMMDYNTSENKWNSYYPTTGASGSMDAGKGFSARISTTDGTVTFTGTLTSGNTTVPLSNAGDGWNCVGNPYPSAINMNTTASAANNFLKTNALDAVNIDPSYCVYVWDDGSKTYQVLNNVPGNPRDPGVNVFAPSQGFFVKANGAGTIQFTTAMQVHNTSAVLKSTDIPWTSVALKATSTSTSSTAQVYFHEGMTKGLDPTYDAGLLRGTNGLSLYTKLIDDNGVDFAIQCLPENGKESFVIPVGLDAKAGSEVKFSATTFGLPTGSSVILEDRTAKVYTDLSNGGEYAVTLSANSSGTGRFYIHTSNLTTGTSDLLPTEGFSLKAYPANGVIWIEGQVSSTAKAYLFNTSGSNLGVFNLQEGSRNSIPASGLATGVYLLKVTDGSKQFNTKIVLN